jgi:hypothetical protein
VRKIPRLTSEGLIILAGSILVTVGIICLYASGAVARTGSWWQSTLDAFGVGLIVGGIVDVTAISLLNQILRGTPRMRRKAGNAMAHVLLTAGLEESTGTYSSKFITEFLQAYGDSIDPFLRRGLGELLDRMTRGTDHAPEVDRFFRDALRRDGSA